MVEIDRLLTFYGPLLTDKQRQCLEGHFADDLSFGELAEQMGISRQAVHDLVRRAEKSLREYEARLGLVGRHLKSRDRARRLAGLVGALAGGQATAEQRAEALALVDEILADEEG